MLTTINAKWYQREMEKTLRRRTSKVSAEREVRKIAGSVEGITDA